MFYFFAIVQLYSKLEVLEAVGQLARMLCFVQVLEVLYAKPPETCALNPSDNNFGCSHVLQATRAM